MLELNEVQLRRGARVLLDRCSATIHPGSKVGLVGANGIGKSSLFQLILGKLEADEGVVRVPKGWRVAHLAQEVAATPRIARDYVLDGDRPLRALQHAIAEAERGQHFEKLGELHEQLDSAGGSTAHSRAEQLLLGLGFTAGDFSRPVNEFSGGWRIRLNLAQALMSPSDLILLDEPTNHLDLDAIMWFERWLGSYPGTALLVSHDREFLDAVVTSIAHMHDRRLDLYPGNYAQFETLRAARLAEQQATYVKQQREIKHMQEFVRRFRYKASKARQAQSRIKAMQRMELIAAAHVDSPFQFTFPRADKTSNPLLTFDGVTLGYGDKPVLPELELQLHPGDRIGLLGHNGAGKSTLVRSLAGELPLVSGNAITGTHLRIGYFSQHQVDHLDLHTTPVAHMLKLEPSLREQSIRTWLGGFGFSGDKALEPVATFSGGEKARLALALIAWRKPNLLLLDEPTNHLDIDMRQALTVALQDFEGAMVLVSHDRHLLRATVDQFLLVHERSVQAFPGDLEDYQRWLDLPPSSAAPQAQKAPPKPEPGADRKRDRKLLHALKMDVAGLERRLARLQTKLAELEHTLADGELYTRERSGDLQDLLRDRVSLTSEIEQAEEEWLQRSHELEQLLPG